MIKDNLDYLKIAERNPEPLLDKYYSKSFNLSDKDCNDSKKLKNSLTSLYENIVKFKSIDKKAKSNKEVKEIIKDIIEILTDCKSAHINYSPFCQFFSVYNSSYSEFLSYSESEKKRFLFEILSKYVNERHNVYKKHHYSVATSQIISDAYSHKRKSTSQINKLKKMLAPYNLKELSDKNTVASDVLLNEDDYYFTSDKKGKMLFDTLLDTLNLEMKSRKKKQDKYPDFVFKHGDDYYIFELKTIKGVGGGQNQSLSEIIEFINQAEDIRKVHYCIFIDSSNANLLFVDNSPKVTKQRESINNALSRHQCNYFLNTKAAKEFFKDIFSD